jgi:hypothetical protein
MSTLTYKGIEYNIVCVDPSIETAGDGLTPSTALNDLPDALENNTCYLFRRTSEDYDSYVKKQSDSSMINLMFLGMPKSSDPKWIQNLITDDEINNAWKDDDAEYANVKFYTTGSYSSNYDACLYFSNIEYLTFINCYIYKNSAASTGTIYAGYQYECLYGTCSKTTFKMYGCKLGKKGFDLDRDEYLNSITSIFDNFPKNSVNSAIFAASYLVFSQARSVDIDHCIINGLQHTQSQGSTSYSSIYITPAAIRINSCKTVSFKNSEINNTPYVYQNPYLSYGLMIENTQNVSIDNILHNAICSEQGIAGGIFIYGGTKYISVTNVEQKFKKINLEHSSVQYYMFPCIYIESAYSKVYLNNFKSHVNDDICLPNYAPLRMYTKYQGTGLPYSVEIKNVDIKLSDSNSNNFYTYDDGTGYSILSLYATYGIDESMGTSESSTMLPSWSTYAGGYNRIGNMQSYPEISNINVDAPYGNIYLEGISANFEKIRGILNLRHGNSIDVKKLINDKLPTTTGMNITGMGNYLRVRDYESVVDEQSNTLHLTANYRANAVYVDKSNVNLFNTTIDTYSSSTDSSTLNTRLYSQACCLNMIQTGRFFIRNSSTFGQSWGVTRSGSTSGASLKLNSNYTSNIPLVIGDYPYKGFLVKPSSTGSKKLVAYFAHKMFDETSDGTGQFIITVRVPQINEDGSVTYINYNSTAADWYDDDSTWSDVDYVAKKIMIPIEVKTTEEPLDVKIDYNWYHNTGYVFLDPDFRIEDDE